MNVLAFETCWAKNKASDISWSIFIQIYIYVFCNNPESFRFSMQNLRLVVLFFRALTLCSRVNTSWHLKGTLCVVVCKHRGCLSWDTRFSNWWFWGCGYCVVMLCQLANGTWRFERPYCLHLRDGAVRAGTVFLRDIRNYLPDDAACLVHCDFLHRGFIMAVC